MSRLLLAVTIGLLMPGAAQQAHDSVGGVYDASRQVKLEGVVTAFQCVNPHPIVEIEVRDRDRTQAWRLEMDNRFELAAAGITADTLRPGDEITVTGSAARDDSRRLYVRRLDRRVDGFRYEQVGSSPRVRLPAR